MKQQRTAITHEDVQRALARFREQGRSITRLNPQPTPFRPLGHEKWVAEINLLDLIAPDSA